AGKTTLFTVLTGLITPDSGEFEVAPGVGPIAYCPDTPAFEPWLTAREVVDQSRILSRSPIETSSLEILARCGLADAAGRRVAGFSRGMTQRLGIAATIATDATLMILDEPSSALDPIGRLQVLDLLRDLGRTRSVVLSSHSLADVEKVAEHLVVIDHGRTIYQGDLDTLLQQHSDPVWIVRTHDRAGELRDLLVREDSVVASEVASSTTVRVRMSSMDAGERNLSGMLARSGFPIVESVLERRDLDAAFARIIGEDS
ncbi:MAG TPA: ABC transporter ATP-binding protein, partial [Thermomicrobiales bacterium]|nr:ABC transporter ATP-binding protein [Thermomicrobiales bacterium]